VSLGRAIEGLADAVECAAADGCPDCAAGSVAGGVEGAPVREYSPKPMTYARTMAEAGRICPRCTHPFGRHEVVAGCVAMAPVDAFSDGPCRSRCECLDRPT
jgi:hypothetical protein